MRRGVLERAAPIYVALLLAVLTVAGLVLLARLGHVLLILFVSVLFAAAVSGPAAWLERLRVPRGLAAVALYVAAFAVVAAIAWLTVPPLFAQLATFSERAPEYADRIERLRTTYESLRDDYPALGSFDAQASRLGERLLSGAGDRVVDLPATAFGLFLDVLSVFVISVLLITSRERLLGFVLSLVHPTDRDLVRSLLAKMWHRIGHYLRAKVVVMAIVGTLTYGALVAIGVPFAVPLAIVVALGEAIPRAGPWLARIPLLGIAALEGWATLGLTFGASVVIENAKGLVISPFVEGRHVDIHPLLVFVAVLAGGALGGFAGAFVAVPAAAMLQVLVEDVVIPWRRRSFAESPS